MIELEEKIMPVSKIPSLKPKTWEEEMEDTLERLRTKGAVFIRTHYKKFMDVQSERKNG